MVSVVTSERHGAAATEGGSCAKGMSDQDALWAVPSSLGRRLLQRRSASRFELAYRRWKPVRSWLADLFRVKDILRGTDADPGAFFLSAGLRRLLLRRQVGLAIA